LTALCAACLLMPAGARAQAPIREPVMPTRDLLTVAATAEVKAVPDVADVRLGVDIEAPTAAQASTTEARTMSSIVAAIKGSGIAERDIRTSDLNLQPVYDNSPNQNTPPKLRGFRASNIVRVTVHNMANIGAVVDAGLAAGANRIEGVNFALTDDTAPRQEALSRAARAAAAKAHTLSEALGVRLGHIASITEGVVNTPGPIPMRAMSFGMAADAATPVLPGQLSLTATVTLQYQIEQ